MKNYNFNILQLENNIKSFLSSGHDYHNLNLFFLSNTKKKNDKHHKIISMFFENYNKLLLEFCGFCYLYVKETE